MTDKERLLAVANEFLRIQRLYNVAIWGYDDGAIFISNNQHVLGFYNPNDEQGIYEVGYYPVNNKCEEYYIGGD